jgi:uncharacterized membrane protein YeaQ/YmgE (transglycosylase-associated protein family)
MDLSNNDKYAIGLLVGLIAGALFCGLDDTNAELTLALSIIGAACGTRFQIWQSNRG